VTEPRGRKTRGRFSGSVSNQYIGFTRSQEEGEEDLKKNLEGLTRKKKGGLTKALEM